MNAFPMAGRLVAAPFVFTLFALFSFDANACSVCQCGDYTATLMGTEKAFPGRLRVALDGVSRKEAQGTPGETERITEERRINLGAAYSFTERVTAAARLPFVDKQFRDPNLSSQRGQGVGDLDLSLRTVLSDTTIPARQLYGVQAGVRLPTGEQLRQNGVPLDIDAQPGAGATVPTVGAFYGRFRYPWLAYASLAASAAAKGNQGYEPAANAVLTLTGQYAFTPRVSVQLAFEGRTAGKNHYSGEVDNNSGGSVAYLTPGVVVRITEELLLNAAVQIQAVDALNGQQRENGEVRIGLTYDLSPEWFGFGRKAAAPSAPAPVSVVPTQ